MARENRPEHARSPYEPDYLLLVSALVLIGFGLVMVMSASGITAERNYGDPYFFFRKQAVYAAIGLGVMYVSWKLPLGFFYRTVYLWLLLAVALLGLTQSPLGIEAGGARRWLDFGPVSFQPYELAKVSLVLYLAYFFSHKQDKIKTFSVGFLPPLLVTGFMAFILLIQPDFGGAAFIVTLFLLLSLAGGTRLVYVLGAVFLSIGAGSYLILESTYRLQRLLAFFQPFRHAEDTGYQVVQSLYGLGAGGIFGQGLGAGRQKLFFLPEAHTDFILSVLGEETGFAGITLVFICLGVILQRCFAIALQQEDLQSRFTAVGLGTVILIGAFLHAAVVLGAVPPKGLPMPFISYGGSNMVVMCFCVGLLLNIGKRKAG
jgi:cell division protein FtsW